MGNCMEFQRERKQKAQIQALRSSQISMQEVAQQFQDEKERINKEITDINRQIDMQVQLYKSGKVTRDVTERVLKDLKLKERLAISQMEKKQTSEIAWKSRALKLADTEMNVENNGKLRKIKGALDRVDINVDNIQDIMVQVDDQLAEMADSVDGVHDMNEIETARSVENTGAFVEEAALSVTEMLNKVDEQAMDLSSLPAPRNRGAAAGAHRILEPSRIKSDEQEEDEKEENRGFVHDDLDAGEDHTVFSNMD